MGLLNIPAGENIPDDIYVIVEIPANTSPVKYEVSKKYGIPFVDRFIPTAMLYPCNYGYINNTVSLDGDPIDALVIAPYPLQLGSVIRCRPIGTLKMIDEAGEDIKIVSVPNARLSKEYDSIKDIIDLPKLLKLQISHFFENYKNLENDKWVKIDSWGDIETAKNEINTSFLRAQKSN